MYILFFTKILFSHARKYPNKSDNSGWEWESGSSCSPFQTRCSRSMSYWCNEDQAWHTAGQQMLRSIYMMKCVGKDRILGFIVNWWSKFEKKNIQKAFEYIQNLFSSSEIVQSLKGNSLEISYTFISNLNGISLNDSEFVFFCKKLKSKWQQFYLGGILFLVCSNGCIYYITFSFFTHLIFDKNW